MFPSHPGDSMARRIQREQWGVPTRVVDRTVTVTTTLTQLVSGNPRRLSWLAENRGSSNVSFGFDREVTAANGYLLGAAGGFATLTIDEDGEGVGYEAHAVAEAGSNVVRVFEVLAV